MDIKTNHITEADVKPEEHHADVISIEANVNIMPEDVIKDIKSTDNIKNMNRGEEETDGMNVKLKTTHLKNMNPSEYDINVNIKPREDDTSTMPNGSVIKVRTRKGDINKNSVTTVLKEKQTDGNMNIKSDAKAKDVQPIEDHNKRKSNEIGMNVKPSFMEQRLIDRLFQFSKSGDLSQIKTIVEGLGLDVNARKEDEWTPLMWAAKRGHVSVVRYLLQNGSDISIVNGDGDTALDIASNHGHQEVIAAIATCYSGIGYSRQTSFVENTNEDEEDGRLELNDVFSVLMDEEIYFSFNLLDRCADKRYDLAWIDETLTLPTTRFMMFSHLRILVKDTDKTTCGEDVDHKLLTVGYHDVAPFLKLNPTVIFLGIEAADFTIETEFEEETAVLRAWFVIDLPNIEDNVLNGLFGFGDFLPPYPDKRILKLEPNEAGIYGHAYALLAWHSSNVFCTMCSEVTMVEASGHKRRCSSSACQSKHGLYNISFPRYSPRVVVLVTDIDGSRCLLFNKNDSIVCGHLSCLEDFVEPGETVESACRRTVHQQTTLRVTQVRYTLSQAWPFKSYLLIGCIAQVITDHLSEQDDLKHGQWFNQDDLGFLTGHAQSEDTLFPPIHTIHNILLTAWFSSTNDVTGIVKRRNESDV